MTDVKLSPVNLKLLQEKKDNAAIQPVNDKPTETNKKAVNKKAICTVAAAIGAAALAATVIHKVIKGRGISLEADDAAQKVQNVVKRFRNYDQSEVTDIVNKNGMLFSGDIPFSGIMEATSKSGKKVKIYYQDGYMSDSYVDGKLFKSYSTHRAFDDQQNRISIPRDKGVVITKYGEDEKPISETVHTFYDNGKIKHSWKKDENGINTKDFFENIQGKNALKAEAKFKDNELIEELRVYDEKGNLKIEGKSNTIGPSWQETHYENGQKIKEKTGSRDLVFDSKNDDMSEYKLKHYDMVKYLDENGDAEKILHLHGRPCESLINYNLEHGKINYTVSSPTLEYAKELEQNPNSHQPLGIGLDTDDFFRSIQMKSDAGGDLSIIGSKRKDTQFTKDELNELVVRLKEIMDIGKKENIQFNSDYLAKQIKAIEEHIQSLS